MSKYDALYEQYWQSDIKKSGTRYERLTAFVLKSLNENHTVIHDIKLIGDSDVKHQIDVTVEEGSIKKRVLIECKDFDVSGDKVGLGIVRDFWGVIDDIHPDEATIVTCNGFTTDAIKYAKSKNIKLAILREFQESDREGRIETICVNIEAYVNTTPRVQIKILSQAGVDKFTNDLQAACFATTGVEKDQPVYLNFKGRRIQFIDYIEELVGEHPSSLIGSTKFNIDFDNTTIEVEQRGGISIGGVTIEYETQREDEYFEVTSDKISKLIISDLSGSDMIIFEQDLVLLKVDESTGEIII
ncbi:TPA: restriction endonuclease [Aeromonas dhakensis]|nr:restriction endonuclease [Aeromonas dhakensis]